MIQVSPFKKKKKKYIVSSWNNNPQERSFSLKGKETRERGELKNRDTIRSLPIE